MITFLHMDDLLSAKNPENATYCMKLDLDERFETKLPGGARQWVGLQISQTLSEHKLCLNQSKHLTPIFHCFQIVETRPLDNPMKDSRILKSQPAANYVARLEPYQLAHEQAIGSLMYLTTETGPDLAFEVSKLALFCKSLTSAPCNAVKPALG